MHSNARLGLLLVLLCGALFTALVPSQVGADAPTTPILDAAPQQEALDKLMPLLLQKIIVPPELTEFDSRVHVFSATPELNVTWSAPNTGGVSSALRCTAPDRT